VRLDLPIIQLRDLTAGKEIDRLRQFVASGTSDAPCDHRFAGYADGLLRSLSRGAMLYPRRHALPLVGRVSMDCHGGQPIERGSRRAGLYL
jgi:alanine racemase